MKNPAFKINTEDLDAEKLWMLRSGVIELSDNVYKIKEKDTTLRK